MKKGTSLQGRRRLRQPPRNCRRARVYPQEQAVADAGIPDARPGDSDADFARVLPAVLAVAALQGGSDGAYGAGIVTGWTEAGNRPEFTLVSGANRALIAMRRPRYDEDLRKNFLSHGRRHLRTVPPS